MKPSLATCTTEILFDGAVTLRQKRRGYRFTVDSVLLADFARPQPDETVVDLGTGSGIIPLVLIYRNPDLTVTGVEIQPDLAELAQANARENGMDKQLTVIHGDVTLLTADCFPAKPDLVVANPPYIPRTKGRLNPMHEKAVARHEITLTLPKLIATASDILKTHGRFAVIYPCNRMDELLAELARHEFGPRRIRLVYPLKDGPPKRVLVESVKGEKPCPVMEDPLYIFIRPGIYSSEVEKMYVARY